MRLTAIFLFVFAFALNAAAQSITGIDFNDKNQYSHWLEGQDDKGTYFIKEEVGIFKNAVFRDNVLTMSKKFPTKEDFNEVYMELVTGYGDPTYYKDKDVKSKKKKEEEKGDYYEEPKEEPIDNRDVETLVQDGEMEMVRIWEFAEYSINLAWTKEGLMFTVKYL